MAVADLVNEFPISMVALASVTLSAAAVWLFLAKQYACAGPGKLLAPTALDEPEQQGLVAPVFGRSDGGDTRAAVCLARGYGRFKHCGLRENPYDPNATPPKYSLVNLDLPLPEMSDSERRGLEQLMERVQDMRSRMMRTDAATMLRFLKARKGNVAAAEAYFRKSCELRERLGTVRMEIDWDLETYERCFAPWWTKGGIIGCGKKGEILGFERFGRCHFPELLRVLPWEVLERLDAVHLIRTLAAMEELSMRRRQNVFGESILILDMEGLGLEYCTPNVARAYGKLVENRDMLCPSTLSTILCIRAPRAASMAWNMFRHVLDEATAKKVRIVSGDKASLELLREFIHDDVIPGYLGGKAHNDGDPGCPLLLGTPDNGPPPREAVEHLLRMVSGNGTPSARGKTQSEGRIGAVSLDKESGDSGRGCWAGACLGFGR